MQILRILGLAGVSLAISACQMSGERRTPIGPEAFYGTGGSPTERVAPQAPPVAPIIPANLATPAETRDRTTLDSSSPTPQPTVQPSSPPVADSQYLTAGAVIADVSGTPIYADKVLQALVPKLSAAARESDLDTYKRVARIEIEKKIKDMIQSELLYTAAVQNLTKEEKASVDNFTMKLRHDMIIAAEGSESLARRRAEAEGISFDDKIQDLYRQVMFDLLRQRKISPQVSVTPDEMRTYYERHLAKFTETSQARFRVIRINAADLDPDIVKGRSRAIDVIKELHDQAVNMNDDDFAKLASEKNHDRGLRSTGGLVGGDDGWLDKGAFAIPEVEEKVWELQPGQVTDPIPVRDSYFLARLEKRKLGRVLPFDDAQVQARIKLEIEAPLLAARQQEFIDKLTRNAVIFPDVYGEPNPQKAAELQQQMVQPVLEMALQKYPEWAVTGARAQAN